MNEKKMSIYHEIHRLHRLGFNQSQIERKVGVNRDTVRKYLEKDSKDMSEWTAGLQNRRKKLDPYEAVPDVEMGAQIQVDWGQTKQKNRENKEVKLYFISFVLSHSRYKYLEWLDRPFTTKDI